MILGAFGHIQGNWPALQAVLGELDAEGIQTLVNTGDSVGDYPWPNEVIQGLIERNIPSVQGELDRLVVRIRRKKNALEAKISRGELEKLMATHDACTSRHIEFLRDLPKKRTLLVDGIRIAVCHGTWTSQARPLEPSDEDVFFQRQREYVPADIFVSGKSHEAFSRFVDSTLFVNPGCIGHAESEEAIAHYAIISTEQEPWSVEFRNVAYSLDLA